jgi:hypothetical protein
MKNASEILSQFDGKSKVIALLILSSIAIFYIGKDYMEVYVEQRSCSTLLEENKRLIQGYVELSTLFREQTFPAPMVRSSRSPASVDLDDDTYSPLSLPRIDTPILVEPESTIDVAMTIINKTLKETQ